MKHMSEKSSKPFEIPLGMPSDVFWAHHEGAALLRAQWILDNIEPSELEKAFRVLPVSDATVVELFAQRLTGDAQGVRKDDVINDAREMLARAFPGAEVLFDRLGGVATIQAVNILLHDATGLDPKKTK
jgi:hypothetical protein